MSMKRKAGGTQRSQRKKACLPSTDSCTSTTREESSAQPFDENTPRDDNERSRRDRFSVPVSEDNPEPDEDNADNGEEGADSDSQESETQPSETEEHSNHDRNTIYSSQPLSSTQSPNRQQSTRRRPNSTEQMYLPTTLKHGGAPRAKHIKKTIATQNGRKLSPTSDEASRDQIKASVDTIRHLCPANPKNPTQYVKLRLSEHIYFDEWNGRNGEDSLPLHTKKFLSDSWIQHLAFHKSTQGFKEVLQLVGATEEKRKALLNAFATNGDEHPRWKGLSVANFDQASKVFLQITLDRITNFFKRFQRTIGSRGNLWEYNGSGPKSGCYITEAGRNRITLKNVYDGELKDPTVISKVKAPDTVLHDLKRAMSSWADDERENLIDDVLDLATPPIEMTLSPDDHLETLRDVLTVRKLKFPNLSYTGVADKDIELLQNEDPEFEKYVRLETNTKLVEINKRASNQRISLAKNLIAGLVTIYNMDHGIQKEIELRFAQDEFKLLGPKQARRSAVVSIEDAQILETWKRVPDHDQNYPLRMPSSPAIPIPQVPGGSPVQQNVSQENQNSEDCSSALINGDDKDSEDLDAFD